MRRGLWRYGRQVRWDKLFDDLESQLARELDSEDLERSSNGWGAITAPGGRTSFQGKPIFYQTAFQQQTTGLVPVIHSEYRSQSIEFNDTIRWGRFRAGWTPEREGKKAPACAPLRRAAPPRTDRAAGPARRRAISRPRRGILSQGADEASHASRQDPR